MVYVISRLIYIWVSVNFGKGIAFLYLGFASILLLDCVNQNKTVVANLYVKAI